MIWIVESLRFVWDHDGFVAALGGPFSMLFLMLKVQLMEIEFIGDVNFLFFRYVFDDGFCSGVIQLAKFSWL